MKKWFQGFALIAATVATGLMAGLFYSYSVSVMPGLQGTDDRTFIGATQSINRELLPGWFVPVFGGALVLTIVAAALHLSIGERSVVPWVVAALVLYIAVLAITFSIHAPLNDELEAAGAPDRISDLAAVRERFEAKWIRWNVARAVASTAAFACLSWALVQSGRMTSRT